MILQLVVIRQEQMTPQTYQEIINFKVHYAAEFVHLTFLSWQ